MPGRQLRYALQERPRGGHVAVGEVFAQSDIVERRRHRRVLAHCRQFGGKNEAGLAGVKEQWLLAKTVAREEHAALRAIIDRERPHAIEPLWQRLAPQSPTVQQHFRIGMIGHEYGAELFQLGAQFLEIVDFAIEDDAQCTVGSRHRLFAASEVEKSEAAKTQKRPAVRLD